MTPIEKILLPDGFKFTGKTLYSSRAEIETPYLYVNGDFIYLYLNVNDGEYNISDYGDFANEVRLSFVNIRDIPFVHKVVDKLNEQKIGYTVWVQGGCVLNCPFIEHVVLNDEELSVDLVKIAKTLSELSHDLTAKNFS